MPTMFFFSVLMSARIRFRQRITEKKKKFCPARALDCCRFPKKTIFGNFSLTLSHLHPIQVENCGRNSRLVADADDNGKFRPERVKCSKLAPFLL